MKPLNEVEIENRVASKLVKLLITKGVTKIIKKYGYLPVDYLNKGSRNSQSLRPSKTSVNAGSIKSLLVKKIRMGGGKSSRSQ